MGPDPPSEENPSSQKDNVVEQEQQSPQMSKRALKKLKKRQEWLDTKSERRAQQRAKRKAKMEQKRADPNFDGMSYYASRKRIKKSAEEKVKSDVHVVFDMSFDHLMNQKDRGKCLKQLLRCYSINRRISSPLQVHVTSFSGRVEEEMGRHDGYQNWDMSFHDKGYKEVFTSEPFNKAAKEIVYLTSESENVIGDTFDSGKVYIVGGLVDHNLHKGLSYKLAKDAQVEHARLPIDEYVDLKTRRVLTIDHVFSIMCEVISEKKTWKEAFMQVLPSRKGAVAKEKE